MSDDNLKDVLVRGRAIDLSREYGAAIVNEIVRRDVTFKVHTRDGDTTEKTLLGYALIGESTPGSPHNLEPFARNLGKITVTIQRLPEFLFTPVNAHRDPMVGLWTLECVPFTEWFRLVVKTDEQILREAGMS
jgi:hypothetical protein